MTINNNNLVQEGQALNQQLESSDSAAVQNRISSSLLGLFTNQPSIILNEELINQLGTTRDLVSLGTRIDDTIDKLPGWTRATTTQTPIQVNGTAIPSTAVGAITATPATLTTPAVTAFQNQQTQINIITNTYTPALDALPNQLNTIKTRLETNKQHLVDIESTQTKIGQIIPVPRAKNLIQTNLSASSSQHSACKDIRVHLERMRTIINEYPTATTGRQTTLRSEFGNLEYAIGQKSGNLPGALQTTLLGIQPFDIGTQINTLVIGDFSTQETTLYNNVNKYTQEIQNRDNLDILEADLQRQRRQLNQTQIIIPANMGLGITHQVIVPASITTLANTKILIQNIDNELNQVVNLENSIPQIRQRYEDNLAVLNQVLPLQKLQDYLTGLNSIPGLTNVRENEINQLVEIGKELFRLKQGNFIPEIAAQTIEMNGSLVPPVNLNAEFVPSGLTHSINGTNRTFAVGYEFANSNGQTLARTGNAIQVSTVTGENYNLTGIQIQGGNLDITNLGITPLENIQFPLRLSLNIRARVQDPLTGMLVDHFKPMILTINKPQALPLADRQGAYNILNTGGLVDQRIEAEYSDHNRTQLENNVIGDMLRARGNSAEIDAIYNDTTRRNIFIERIRRIPGLIPVIPLNTLQTGFYTDVTRLNRDVPLEYLRDQNTFLNYLSINFDTNVRNFVKGEINRTINTANNRDQILQELMHFQTDLANNKVDNNDHLRALAAVPGSNPQGHPDGRFQRLTHRRSNKNNYTKFFEGREQNIADQTMETENGPVKYSVNIECTGVNKMTATIKIDGKDEPEIIDGANHNALVKAILERRNTKDGEPLNRKLRCHIAIDIIKAVVMMSPQRLHREITPIALQNTQGNNVMCDRIEAFVRNGSLMIRGGSVNPGTRVRENVSLFDEQRYKNLHDAAHLEHGIIELSTQMNSIMNAMTGEYQQAVSTIGNKSLRTYNTNQFLRFGPAKKLFGRIAYGKTNRDFDFNTTANAGKKSVNIELKKGVFTLSGEFNGEKYEFKGRNLGTLLRKKIDRKRIFDGIELDIVAQVNESMVGRLRKNNMVGPEAFGVADLNHDKTGRVYIMDDAGNLSYLEIEDRNLNPIPNGQAGRIPLNNIPPQRIRCNEAERREFMQNPFLSGRLIRSMRRRLAVF